MAASLRHSPALAARIESARYLDDSGRLFWKPEDDRVRRVVVKLARGYVVHQYGEPQLDDPESIVMGGFLKSVTPRSSFPALRLEVLTLVA